MNARPATVKVKKPEWHNNGYCRTYVSNNIAQQLLDLKNNKAGSSNLRSIAANMKIEDFKSMSFDLLKEKVVDGYLKKIVSLRDVSNPLPAHSKSRVQYEIQEMNWFILQRFKEALFELMTGKT